MRLGDTQIIRSAYYDRNPSNIIVSFYGNISPHARTTRDTYTVPANRNAFLGGAFVQILRSIAASTVDEVELAITLNTIVLIDEMILSLVHFNNGVLSVVWNNVSPQLLLVSADVVRIISEDLSVGGSLRYRCGVSITEFDA